MFLINILNGQYVKLTLCFLSSYVTRDIELIQYYSFFVIQHALKPIVLKNSFLILSWRINEWK